MARFIEVNIVSYEIIEDRDGRRYKQPLTAHARATTINTSMILSVHDAQISNAEHIGPRPAAVLKMRDCWSHQRINVAETKAVVDEMLGTKRRGQGSSSTKGINLSCQHPAYRRES